MAENKYRAFGEICEMWIVAAGTWPYAEVWPHCRRFCDDSGVLRAGLRAPGRPDLPGGSGRHGSGHAGHTGCRAHGGSVFSRKRVEIWAGRRTLAKAWDSYQWQKLFYIGVGLMSFYSVFSGELSVFRVALCLSCVVFGAVGVIQWRIVARTIPGENADDRRRPSSASSRQQ